MRGGMSLITRTARIAYQYWRAQASANHRRRRGVALNDIVSRGRNRGSNSIASKLSAGSALFGIYHWRAASIIISRRALCRRRWRRHHNIWNERFRHAATTTALARSISARLANATRKHSRSTIRGLAARCAHGGNAALRIIYRASCLSINASSI